jgi:hypothetical protein
VPDEKYEYRRTNVETGETKRWIGTPGAGHESTSKAPFLMMYQQALVQAATNFQLKGFDLRVYMFLCGILDEENWIDVHHGRIARQLGKPKQRSAVTRSINNLVDQGVLLKGTERTYRLNPGYGWKGNRVAQAAAEKEAIAGRLSVVRP